MPAIKCNSKFRPHLDPLSECTQYEYEYEYGYGYSYESWAQNRKTFTSLPLND